MSLIAHYPLTDDVNDYSGNDRHLNNNGLTTLEDGKIGKAFRFTGTNYANRPENVLSHTMSFAAWINADNTTEDMTIVKLDQSAMGMGYVNNTFRIWIWDGVSLAGDQAFCTETQVKTWNHFAGTYDGSELKLYKNGKLISTTKCTQQPRTDGAKFITVGCRESATYPFKGLINDVRIYNHVLSAKEIKELSKAKILHYKFDSSLESNVKINDCSGLNNHSAYLEEQFSPQWINNSKIGTGCYYFDKTKNASIQTDSYFPVISEYTASAWVKLENYNVNETYATLLSISKNTSKYALWINYNSSGKIQLTTYSNTYHDFITNETIPLNKWTHIAVTAKAGEKTIIYLNGEKIHEYTNKNITMDSDCYFFVGNLRKQRDLSFNGFIDDVRMYATVLDEEAIKDLAHCKTFINKDGIVFAHELVEQSNVSSINCSGQVKANVFNEIGIVTDLIAYYPFDKDANDYSGNNNHLSGTYTEVNGINNKATSITNALTTNLAFPVSGTVSAWGNYTTTGTEQMLFSFNTDTSVGPDLYFAHNVISWNKADGAANPFKKNGVSQGYPSINEWHHYVVVINAESSKVTLYIDGEYCGDANYVSPAQSDAKKFVVGAYQNATSYLWKGSIDNVKISSHCWSEQEVKIEYETTANNKVLINKDGTFYAKCFDEILI